MKTPMSNLELPKDQLQDPETSNVQEKEANACIGVGASVGALGAGAAALGAVCPVCFIVAPALVGIGLYQRNRSKKNQGS